MHCPKIMVITSMKRLPLPGRIALAFADAGCSVAVVSPGGSLVRKLSRIEKHFAIGRWSPTESLLQAIQEWVPCFLICGDEPAVGLLRDLHRSLRSSRRVDRDDITSLIETSLGNPEGYEVAAKKSKFMHFAQSIGLRSPATTIVTDVIALKSALRAVKLPAVLKADGTWAGQGVRVVNSEAEAALAFNELARPPHWLSVLGQAVRSVTPRPMVDRILARERVVTLQAYVHGHPANRAMVSWRGEVLAGLSVEALEVSYANGPAAVVRTIDNDEMAYAGKALAQNLGISGFFGLDFMIDREGRAWLLELNPRVTPICHLSNFSAFSMPHALLAGLSGRSARSQAPGVFGELIALFPGGSEWAGREKAFRRFYYDIPADEPDFVKACLALNGSKRHAGSRTYTAMASDALHRGFAQQIQPAGDEA